MSSALFSTCSASHNRWSCRVSGLEYTPGGPYILRPAKSTNQDRLPCIVIAPGFIAAAINPISGYQDPHWIHLRSATPQRIDTPSPPHLCFCKVTTSDDLQQGDLGFWTSRGVFVYFFNCCFHVAVLALVLVPDSRPDPAWTCSPDKSSNTRSEGTLLELVQYGTQVWSVQSSP